jgi:hypothetical protein
MSSPRVLVVFDVDGTISPLPPRDGSSEPEWVTPVPEPVLAVLQELTTGPDVLVGWGTSWSPDMVRWLIDERLDGRLDGRHLHDDGDWAPGWRARSITRAVARTGARAVVWFDDMAVRATLTRTLERAGLSPAVLVIRPDKHTGITLRQARRAAQFVDDFRDNLWNRCDASGSFP